MQTLGREIRFSIDPFSRDQKQGYNSYAAKPLGSDGLALYISLWVELSSELNPDTGFVVNVTEIDKAVRKEVIPFVTRQIQLHFNKRQIPLFADLADILKKCRVLIQQAFPDQVINKLILNLNPYRSISIQPEDNMTIYYGEKFEFSAMHRLWNDKFNDAQNDVAFGKCANPAGHGHNYILEVKVIRSADDNGFNWAHEFQKVVKKSFIDIVDHKNLNIDVPGFEACIPTVENLARFAWEKLADSFHGCKLHSITVWENDRTYCVYSGQ